MGIYDNGLKEMARRAKELEATMYSLRDALWIKQEQSRRDVEKKRKQLRRKGGQR